MSDKKEPHQFSRLAQELIGEFRHVPDETPRQMRKRATKPLAGLIEALIVKHQIGCEGPEQRIREHWGEIVGHANAHYSHAATIDERGRLAVLASHAVVRNELFHNRKLIVSKIQKLPGCAHVRELNVRAG